MRKIKPKQDEYTVGIGMGKKKEKAKPVYPTFRIDLDHLPEAKDWKVGKTYMISMKVKQVGLSQSRFDNSAEFEIREIEGKDAGESDKEEEYEGEEENG